MLYTEIRKVVAIFTVLIFGLGWSEVRAQDYFRLWEGEIFAGANIAPGQADDLNYYSSALESKALVGYTVGAELRRNLEKLPLDLGLRLAFSKHGQNVLWAGSDYWPPYWSKSYNNSFTLAAVADWKFRRDRAVSFFAGAGVGIAMNEYLSYESRFKPFVMPRIGISIKDKVRLTLSADISEPSHNAVQLAVGYVFGSSGSADKSQSGLPDGAAKLMRQSNVLLWCGVGTLVLGTPILVTGLWLIGGANDEIGAALGALACGVGGLITLSSVPLFIFSQKKKNQALRLSFNLASISAPMESGNYSSTTGVGLALTF